MAKEKIKNQDAKPEKKPSMNAPGSIKKGKMASEKWAENKTTVVNPINLTNKEKVVLEEHLRSIKLAVNDKLNEGYSFIQKEINVSGRHIICATIVKGKAGNEEEKEEKKEKEEGDGKPKIFTAKEIKDIQKEIKAQLKLFLTLPPPVFVNIKSALKISDFNASAICTYTIDKLVRIAAIPVFDTGCLPTVAAVQLVYDNLLPLAGVSTNTLNLSDKNNKKTWTKDLKRMLSVMSGSCAGLANGDLSLYLLTGFGVRKTAVSFNAQLEACVFRITTNHGGDTLGVDCDPIAYAKNYTIYYSNLVPFTLATATQQTGPSSQLLKDLIGGDMMTIIMIANGKKIQGKKADPQTRRVPYN